MGVWVFGFACYYFEFKTHMAGLLQGAYFFGYSALVCVAMACMGAFVAHQAAALFVRQLYNAVKSE